MPALQRCAPLYLGPQLRVPIIEAIAESVNSFVLPIQSNEISFAENDLPGFEGIE
jgi:hypothetical protein